MYPQLSLSNTPVFHVVMSSNVGKSLHLEAQVKGGLTPVEPTQYVISTSRDRRSRDAKKGTEMPCGARSLCGALGIFWFVRGDARARTAVR